MTPATLMHQLQTQTTTMSHLIERVIEFIDRADFVISQKHISLSEMSLFLATSLCGIWQLFGLSPSGSISVIFPTFVWSFIFCGLAAFKAVSLFLPYIQVRLIGVLASALMWTFLLLIALWTKMPGIAVPVFTVFAVMSTFISVRLIRDKGRVSDVID